MGTIQRITWQGNGFEVDSSAGGLGSQKGGEPRELTSVEIGALTSRVLDFIQKGGGWFNLFYQSSIVLLTNCYYNQLAYCRKYTSFHQSIETISFWFYKVTPVYFWIHKGVLGGIKLGTRVTFGAQRGAPI